MGDNHSLRLTFEAMRCAQLTDNALPVDVASGSCLKVSFEEIDRFGYFNPGPEGEIHSSSTSGCLGVRIRRTSGLAPDWHAAA
jgi:hypothetical protein